MHSSGRREAFMQHIDIQVEGVTIDFNLARQMGEQIAGRDSDEATLVSWCDSLRGVHSPQSLHCEIKGEPGWLVYGRTHGGRLRIGFNNDAFILIYS